MKLYNKIKQKISNYRYRNFNLVLTDQEKEGLKRMSKAIARTGITMEEVRQNLQTK